MKTRPSSRPRALYKRLLTLGAGTLFAAVPLNTAIGSVIAQAPAHVSASLDRSCVPSHVGLPETGIQREGREGRIRVAQTGGDKGAAGRKAGKTIENAPAARMGVDRCPDECSLECCKNCRGCVCCMNPDMRAPQDNESRIKGGYKPLPK
jgi:hypothetical protein